MTSTTQILFNSPALHSLKRDQLVKLCKHHSLKANGKNGELIDRLKQRATELTELGQLPDEALDENEENELGAELKLPRPSEQWEMVMDDIEEVDETNGTLTSMGTLRSKRSAGEFGTAGSKSSVTSSLKAIASSFGLTKRAAIDKSTVASTSSAPAALITSESTEKNTRGPFAPARPSDSPAPEPIPGNASRPGLPAPPNARLSTGAGITTTVRLISTASFGSPQPSPPRLAPYQTTFDLDMGTPGVQGPGHPVNVWPASPGMAGRLYPAIPYEDLKPTPLTKFLAQQTSRPSSSNASTPSKGNSQELPRDLPDMFSPSRAPGSIKKLAGRISAAQDEPFTFGSPLPQHKMTNKDFGHAASSVLEEMNRRLAEAGAKKVDGAILEGENKAKSDVFGIPARPTHKKTDSGERFAKAHEDAYNKMDSIATHYAARRVLQAGQVSGTNKRKSEALGLAVGPAAKRKSSAVVHPGARVISNGVRRNMGIPGGFGDEDDEDEDEAVREDAGDRRASKRMRVADTAEVHKGRRVSLLPEQDGQTPEEREKEERRKERERDAIKRKLDESRARRRSSRARVSMGRAPPPKPSRFGFLASAKSMVRNVWNMGAGVNKNASNVPASKAPKAQAANVAGSSKGHNRVPSGSNLLKPTASAVAKTQPATSAHSTVSSSHLRPPIPSFNGKNSTNSRSGSTTTSQASSAASRASVKPTSTAGPSSMGTKTSAIPSSNVTSLGTRKSSTSNSAKGAAGPAIEPSLKRTTSRLLAPTASSLAKRHGIIVPTDKGTHLAPVAEKRRFASPSSLLPITNSLSPRSTVSPRPTKIFSKPLDGFGSPPPEGPSHPQSLGSAASTLLARASENAHPQPDVKPKVVLARKPRISRSRVIAKLGAQRAATTPSGSATAGAAGPGLKPAPRARSSIGAAPRHSLGVKQNRVSGGDMLMSAKKKARQSEYARRRSQIASPAQAEDVASKLARARAPPRGEPVDVSMEIDG